MPIPLDKFSRLRPWLYHLTAAANVGRILRTRRIESATRLLILAGRPGLVQVRRRSHVSIEVDGESVQIRDQAPLHQGNAALPGGWGIGDLVSLLNDHVFFWPGTGAGPISYGLRHFQRYVDEKPAILRVTTVDLLSANTSSMPRFCRYNSGSPRCSNGRKSPRSAGTFVDGEGADFGPAAVVEVTFPGGLDLPAAVQLGSDPSGPWRLQR